MCHIPSTKNLLKLLFSKVINFSWHLIPWEHEYFLFHFFSSETCFRFNKNPDYDHEQMWWYCRNINTAWGSKKYKNCVALHGTENSAHMFALLFQISTMMQQIQIPKISQLNLFLCTFLPKFLKQFMFIQISDHWNELCILLCKWFLLHLLKTSTSGNSLSLCLSFPEISQTQNINLKFDSFSLSLPRPSVC